MCTKRPRGHHTCSGMNETLLCVEEDNALPSKMAVFGIENREASISTTSIISSVTIFPWSKPSGPHAPAVSTAVYVVELLYIIVVVVQILFSNFHQKTATPLHSTVEFEYIQKLE